VRSTASGVEGQARSSRAWMSSAMTVCKPTSSSRPPTTDAAIRKALGRARHHRELGAVGSGFFGSPPPAAIRAVQRGHVICARPPMLALHKCLGGPTK